MAGQLRSSRRRACWALLWALVLFYAVEFGAGWLLDYRFPEVRFPSAGRVLGNLRSSPRAPEIVGLGSSRFEAGFQAEEIQAQLRQLTGDESVQACNAAVGAGDLVTADYLMERMLAQGTRPAVVVIEVSPETLGQRNQWLNQHVFRQLRWDDLPIYFDDLRRAECLDHLFRSRVDPIFVHRRELRRTTYNAIRETWLPDLPELRNPQAEEEPVPAEPVPKKPSAVKVARTPKDAVDHPKGHRDPKQPRTPNAVTLKGVNSIRRWLEDYQLGGTAAEALDRLIRRCQEQGITVILVGVPVSSFHRELYTAEIDAAFRSHMQHLAETYHCQFVDYRDRIPDLYFRDHHHLEGKGGSYFSWLLVQEVLAPAWQARRNQSEHLASSTDSDCGAPPLRVDEFHPVGEKKTREAVIRRQLGASVTNSESSGPR